MGAQSAADKKYIAIATGLTNFFMIFACSIVSIWMIRGMLLLWFLYDTSIGCRHLSDLVCSIPSLPAHQGRYKHLGK